MLIGIISQTSLITTQITVMALYFYQKNPKLSICLTGIFCDILAFLLRLVFQHIFEEQSVLNFYLTVLTDCQSASISEFSNLCRRFIARLRKISSEPLALQGALTALVSILPQLLLFIKYLQYWCHKHQTNTKNVEVLVFRHLSGAFVTSVTALVYFST